MTITPSSQGAPKRPGFNPFPDLRIQGDSYPPEPATGSVVAWQTSTGEPAVAVRTTSGWAIAGDDETTSWQAVLDQIGKKDSWVHVGVAQTWTALIPARPRTRDGADT